MMKRCAISAVTRDKEYNITKGTPKSRILYMSVNPNGEAEVLKIIFRQKAKLKKAIVDLDFSQLAIKGRASQGNIFSRNPIHKILLKSKGASTLAGQQIWYDEDVKRLNDSGHGKLLGEFEGNDKIIVFTSKDQFYTTGYDVGHHFPEDTTRVEKYDSAKIYSVIYWDSVAKFYYVKRFMAEANDKMSWFVDEENPKSKAIALTDEPRPAMEVVYGGVHATKPSDVIDVAEFIGVKGYKAKGKRVTTYEVEKLRFIPSYFAPTPTEPEGEQGEQEKEQGDESAVATPQPDFEVEQQSTPEVAEEQEVEAAAPAVEPEKPKARAKAEPKPKEIAKEEPKVPEEKVPEVVEAPTVVPLDDDEPVAEGPTEDVVLEIIVPTGDDEPSHNPDIQQLNLF